VAGAAVRKLLADKGHWSQVSSSSNNSVTMALKLAPPFHNTSAEVQVGPAAASLNSGFASNRWHMHQHCAKHVLQAHGSNMLIRHLAVVLPQLALLHFLLQC
jgi:hypothetical protein